MKGNGDVLNPGSTNWSSKKIGPGRYRIDFDVPATQYPTVTATVVTNCDPGEPKGTIATCNHQFQPPSVDICISEVTTGEPHDSDFSFIAFLE